MEGRLDDIYDGKIWKEFYCSGGVPFLSVPYNFALTSNIDWFQPFKRTQYASGAIYISIQNLPREERFSVENIILVGIIPGPNEPSKVMNSYLTSLVDELKKLWHGVIMQSDSNSPVFVRAALICTACDIPAARKVNGFVGTNALRGCSRCMKMFPTDSFGEKPDYTGFDRSTWEPRLCETHRMHAENHRKATTAKERNTIERDYGCRYSVLLDLPYYDVIRMFVVDPMHNLLLGTSKRMIEVWRSFGYITDSHLKLIQEKVDNFTTPSYVGRIPTRIASGFSGFTADQWRNWTLLYSLCCLKDLLPFRDYDCWLLFVKACHLLCRRSITLKQLEEADTFLLEFCHVFETLYGKDHCTINIHLHGHLKECIKDFGSVYAFWLFGFERLNGILGSYHTNCHDISLQLMRCFQSSHRHGTDNWPSEYKAEFVPIISHCLYDKGSLMSESLEHSLETHDTTVIIKPMPPVYEHAWLPHQKQGLLTTATELLGYRQCQILTLFQKCKALSIGGFIVGSKQSQYTTSSHVIVKHPKHPHTLRLTRIEFFSKVNIDKTMIEPGVKPCFWIAVVSLYDEHPCKVWFGHPTEVWATSTVPDWYFIPVSYVISRVAYSETEVDFGRVIGSEK